VFVEHALPRALVADAHGHVHELVVAEPTRRGVGGEEGLYLGAERGLFGRVVEVHGRHSVAQSSARRERCYRDLGKRFPRQSGPLRRGTALAA
jgi:hypothetical protein